MKQAEAGLCPAGKKREAGTVKTSEKIREPAGKYHIGGTVVMDKKAIIQLIQDYDQDRLKELIIRITADNSAAQKVLLEYCRQHGRKDTAGGPDAARLLLELQLKQHWQKARRIIARFDEYGGGPDAEEATAYDELRSLQNLQKESGKGETQASWKIRKEILDGILQFVASDNSGFTDELVDTALTMCMTREEKFYVADFLARRGGFYYRGVAARMYLQAGEDEKYLECKKANLMFGSDYLELADYYEKHGEKKHALEIVQEALQKADGRMDEIYRYLFRYYRKEKNQEALEKLYRDAVSTSRNQDTITELMYQYYKETGDYEKQKETLLRLLSCSDTRQTHKLYERCRQEMTEEDFRTEEEHILKLVRKRSLAAYFDILLEKDDTGEIIEYLMQNPQQGAWGLDAGHKLTKKLIDKYPGEVAELYWREAAYYAAQGKEKNYSQAAGILKEIRKILITHERSAEWSRRYGAFLEEHRRKRTLMKALEGIQA